MKEKVMNGLEKFSKAMLSPLSYISAAGLILVLGALLTSTSLSAMIPVLQWTPIKLLGQLIYNCIMVIINNLSLMFCVGIAAALAKKNKQQAAIIGLMSYFMYLTAGNVTLTQLGMLAEADPMVGLYGTGQSTVFGIQTVDMGVFGGILLGLVCGWVYNRTCEKQFKGIITQIYSGNRWSFTCMVVFSILFGFGSCFFWPPVQNVISGYALRLESRRKKAEQARERHMKLQMDENALSSRVKMLTEMEKLHEGYSKAVKLVMGEAQRGSLQHIHGPVADLLKVPEEYTVAIETALGGAMQNLVVDREEDGKAVINYLKRRDGGRRPGHHSAPQLHPAGGAEGGTGPPAGARLRGGGRSADLLPAPVPERVFQPAGPGGGDGGPGPRHRSGPEIRL